MKGSIKEPIDVVELFGKLAPLVVSLGDGHTNLYPSDSWLLPKILEENLLFPFVIEIVDSVFVIKKNLSEVIEITEGSSVIAIDNIPTQTLIKHLIKYCNGERMAFRQVSLAYYFFLYHYLFYNKTGYFDIAVKSPGQDVTSFRLSGITYPTLQNAKQNAGRPYSFSILNEETGLMDFNLMINQEKFVAFSKVLTKVSSPLRTNLDQYKKYQRDTLLVFEGKPEHPFPSNPFIFKGNIYLLISSSTFSSAVDFSSIIKDYELATVIGKETGGLATSFGEGFEFSLPFSKISGRISYKKFIRPSGEDTGKGVIPDYIIGTKNETDDAVLKFTLDMIETNSH